MKLKDFAVSLAEDAGKIILENYNKPKESRFKNKHDLVTNVDLQIERMLTQRIHNEFPDHDIICEEEDHRREGGGYTWFIDPLDGTHNYFFGLPMYGVSIGIAKEGEMEVGILNLPELEYFFISEKGKGSFLNGQRIGVSDRSLSECLVISDSRFYEKPEMLKTFGEICNNVFGTRALGCAVFNFGAVAKGSADSFFQFNSLPWDIAAGALLVEEAGGKVTDFEGNPWKVDSKDILASNGKIHNELLELIEESGYIRGVERGK